MNSHLSLKVNGHELALRPGQSISFEDQNPLFNDVEMFSYPFEMPFEKNRVLLQNVDDPTSDLRPIDFEHQPAIVYAEGIPYRSGTTVIQEDETLESGMAMNLDAATQSFDDLIGDLKCNDVPLKDRIQIGEKIGHVHVEVKYDYEIKIKYDGKKGDKEYHYNKDTAVGDFEPSVTAFSYPGLCQVTGSKQVAVENTSKTKIYPKGEKVIVPREKYDYANSTFINVTDAYGENSEHWGEGGAKYCNARVCYKHYGLNEDGTTSSDVMSLKEHNQLGGDVYEDHYPYWVLDADRPASGLCFYVLYFLDCLFAYLGVEFDKTALLAVEDFKHLCFFSTHIRYDVEEVAGYPTFTNLTDVNKWLTSRGCGGQLAFGEPEPKSIEEFKYCKNGEIDPETGKKKFVTVKVGDGEVQSIETKVLRTDITKFEAKILSMWANSDCFPEESVKTVLDSLQASFGIRFYYDYERHKVTAYLLRDVFRSQADPLEFQGTVHQMHKVSEKITGFRMKYSAESTSKEQEQYIRRQKRDYDTDFDYREYPEGRTVIDKTFEEIVNTVSSTNTNVYVDRTTGNAYRIKINKEATTTSDMKPALFEVAQFHGIEVGDCSPENEDFVKEYVSDFQPISFNDVNYEGRVSAGSEEEIPLTDGVDTYDVKGMKSGGQPMLVAYVDEDMEHEFVEQKINNPLSAVLVDLYLTEVLKMVESYDPSDTDEGESPLQDYDWGLAVAMMRGGGTDMEIQRYDPGYDGFGNDKWRTVAGEYALTTDTMDQMGNQFDYNGTMSGIGDGERFSLKITAYRSFRYKYVDGKLKISTNPKEWSDPSWLVPCDPDVEDQQHRVQEKIRSRGLYDSFMSELAHFLLNRKKYRIKVGVDIGQLADIPNHWRERWRIGDKVGYINKVSYELSVDKALTEAEIEFYAI